MLLLLKLFYHFIFLLFFAMALTFFIALAIGLAVPRPNHVLKRVAILAVVGLLILVLVMLTEDFGSLFLTSILLGFAIGFSLPDQMSWQKRLFIYIALVALFLLVLLPCFLASMNSGFRGLIF